MERLRLSKHHPSFDSKNPTTHEKHEGFNLISKKIWVIITENEGNMGSHGMYYTTWCVFTVSHLVILNFHRYLEEFHFDEHCLGKLKHDL